MDGKNKLIGAMRQSMGGMGDEPENPRDLRGQIFDRMDPITHYRGTDNKFMDIPLTNDKPGDQMGGVRVPREIIEGMGLSPESVQRIETGQPATDSEIDIYERLMGGSGY